MILFVKNISKFTKGKGRILDLPSIPFPKTLCNFLKGWSPPFSFLYFLILFFFCSVFFYAPSSSSSFSPFLSLSFFLFPHQIWDNSDLMLIFFSFFYVTSFLQWRLISPPGGSLSPLSVWVFLILFFFDFLLGYWRWQTRNYYWWCAGFWDKGAVVSMNTKRGLNPESQQRKASICKSSLNRVVDPWILCWIPKVNLQGTEPK